MPTFEQMLLRFVAPRLKSLGYEYNEVLRDRNLFYGFHKHLGDNIRTIVSFVRLQENERAVGYGFTVDLVRSRTQDVANWHRGSYEGYLHHRLGEVLWTSLGLRIYSWPDHWWEPTNIEELKGAFADALDKLERYGLPWLEDPQIRNAVPLSVPEWSDFQATLLKKAAPDLEALGYEPKEDNKLEWHEALRRLRSSSPTAFGSESKELAKLEWHPQREMPQHFFTKPLWGDLRGFVLFNPSKPPSPRVIPEFGQGPTTEPVEFDVLVIRKKSTDPYDTDWVSYEDCFEIWLSKYLSSMSQLRTGLIQPVVWKYTSQAELEASLQDALDKVKTYGIRLLESPDTKTPSTVR